MIRKKQEKNLKGMAYETWFKNCLSCTENVVPPTLTKVPASDGIYIYCCTIKKPWAAQEHRAEECTADSWLSHPATAGCLIPEHSRNVIFPYLQLQTTSGHALALPCDIRTRCSLYFLHTLQRLLAVASVCNREKWEYSEVCKEFNPLFSQNTKPQRHKSEFRARKFVCAGVLLSC